MRIGIGNDHSALELKAEIIEFLKEKGHEVVDFGTDTSEIWGSSRPCSCCKRSGLWNLDLRYRTGNISCSKQGQRSACSSLQRAVYSEDVQSTQ